jgi:hypothetical protein
MREATAELWPWLVVAGLGVFHGINPAMGWLFAVGLGLNRRNRPIVLLSLVPIALGHAAAIALVVTAVLALGLVVELKFLRWLAGAVLIGWAAWHAVRGHRQRLRVGMQTGLAGLALWSFLMANAHGAGLMLIPVLIPLCLASAGAALTASGSIVIGLAAIGVHTGAMLATIAVISVAVYEWVGLAFLRSGWINLDLVWTAALGLSGALVLLG